MEPITTYLAIRTISGIFVSTANSGIRGILSQMFGGRRDKKVLLKHQLDLDMLRQNREMELKNNLIVQKLCHDYHLEEVQVQFENAQALREQEHQHRVEEMQIQFENAQVLQLLNYKLRVREAGVQFQRQLDMKYDETMWPLRTPFTHFSLEQIVLKNKMIPVRVFMAKTGKKSKYTEGIEDEFKTAMSNFIHTYNSEKTHPVVSHIGEWKEKDPRQDDAFINALWNGLKGQPIIVVNPMYSAGEDSLDIRISQWGFSSDESNPSTLSVAKIPFGLVYGQLVREESRKYNAYGLPGEMYSLDLKANIKLIEQEELLKEKGVSEEAINRLLTKYVLADEIKNEVIQRLTSMIGEVISTILGLYIDIYYLVEYGLAPRLVEAMSQAYPHFTASSIILKQYHAALTSLCMNNYQRDELAITFLKVAEAFLQPKTVDCELKDEIQELVYEAVAIWGNRIREVTCIPCNIAECMQLIQARKSAASVNDSFLIPLKEVLLVLGYTEEAEQLLDAEHVNADFDLYDSKATSSFFEKKVAASPNPSNQLVEMVKVDGGTFARGENQITVSPYYIGKYPVTQRQWKEVMGDNPSHFPGDNNPVECVSWYKAVEFCNKLSEKEGFDACYLIRENKITLIDEAVGYRLPTEAEWEFAARGGTKKENFTYSGGNDLDKVGWFTDNSSGQTHAVGFKKAPNGLGLYDMSGNVCEWCWDWYGNYASSNQTDPLGAPSGSYRVNRGGCWNYSAGSCAVSCRNLSTPGLAYTGLGFRLVFASSSK